MRFRSFLLFALISLIPAAALPQNPKKLTAADYARAESFLSANTTPLVSGMMMQPTWLSDGRLVSQQHPGRN